MERTYSGDYSLRGYLNSVFGKMCLGLLVTALVSFIGASSGLYFRFVSLTGGLGTLILCIAEMMLSWNITSHMFDFDSSKATGLFYIFAAVNGFSLSSLFYAYNIGTLFGAFAFTAILFACFMIIGKYTNVDMSKFSGLLMGGLMALVICSLLSFFLPIFRMNMMINYIGLFIFFGLTVFDIQTVTRLYYRSGYAQESISVYGALNLYLDFINIFIRVFAIMGRYNNDNN